MNQEQKNMALIGGAAASLISLPMAWFTVKASMGTGIFGEGMSFSASVNGFRGALLGIPIWLVMFAAAGAAVMQFLRAKGTWEAPPAAEWGVAVAPAALVVLGIIRTFTLSGVSPGLGMFLGLAGCAVPIVCLAMPSEGEQPLGADKYDPSM